jgi:DNA repair protein RadC
MLEQKCSIPHWAEDDRPREKMVLKGRHTLSDAELLAIIIGTGSGQKSAVDLGRELLALSNGDLFSFGKLRLNQLTAVKGIGSSKAVAVMAALELGRRRKEMHSEKRIKITSATVAYNLLRGYYQDLMHEECYVIYVNNANDVLQIKQLSIGGQSATLIDAKIVFKLGIDLSATGIILSHNHPSGQLKPSEADLKLTKKIVRFGEMIEMNVLDHLIITDNGYFSFANENLL